MKLLTALALMLALVACAPPDETQTTFASAGETSASRSASQTPSSDPTEAAMTDRELACTAIALTEVSLPTFEREPVDEIDRATIALQLAVGGADIKELAEQGSGTVANQVRTLGERIQRTSEAIGAGLTDDRLWLDTYTELRANFSALC